MYCRYSPRASSAMPHIVSSAPTSHRRQPPTSCPASLQGGDAESRRIGDRLQRALEQAIDAEGPDEAEGAQRELEQVLTGAREAGMQLSAEIGEVDVDGVLGTMKMRVLSTVLAPPAPLAA